MGRQINFFTSRQDTKDLESWIAGGESIALLLDRSSEACPRRVETLLHEEDGRR